MLPCFAQGKSLLKSEQRNFEDTLQLLEKMGLIERIVKTIKMGELSVPNCLFIKLNVDAVRKISFLSQEQLCENLEAAEPKIMYINRSK